MERNACALLVFVEAILADALTSYRAKDVVEEVEADVNAHLGMLAVGLLAKGDGLEKAAFFFNQVG